MKRLGQNRVSRCPFGERHDYCLFCAEAAYSDASQSNDGKTYGGGGGGGIGCACGYGRGELPTTRCCHGGSFIVPQR
jgi:hypothetical protein